MRPDLKDVARTTTRAGQRTAPESARTDARRRDTAPSRSEHPHPVSKRVAAGAVAALATVILAACGASGGRARTGPDPVGTGPSAPGPTPSTTATTAVSGPIQGWDNNGQPYGDFKVTLTVAPHLESLGLGGPYSPSNPLQPDGTCYSGDGYCDPAGYQFIHFTVSISNPTASPEVFGPVGFASVEQPIVYLAGPSTDGGQTPATGFGGPTDGLEPVTVQNRDAYWEANHGSAPGFPASFTSSHFFFNLNPPTSETSVGGSAPGTLAPGQSVNMDYISGPVAPTSPVVDLSVWAGVNPQMVSP